MSKNHIFRKITERADLQGEPIAGIPLLELNGDDRVLIENYNCVISYSQDEVCVKVRFGCLRICGQSLVLARAGKDQLIIHGNVNCIMVERGL